MKTRRKPIPESVERRLRRIEPSLFRTDEAAAVLGVCVSQVLKFQRDGLLRKIEIPEVRSVRFSAIEVRALAQRWIDASIQNDESPSAAR